jgi:hypothetical protein
MRSATRVIQAWGVVGPTISYGVSRFRPLRRRRLMIARPARVRILARKPCVFARFRRFGW